MDTWIPAVATVAVVLIVRKLRRRPTKRKPDIVIPYRNYGDVEMHRTITVVGDVTPNSPSLYALRGRLK